jgi:hypothetical protein
MAGISSVDENVKQKARSIKQKAAGSEKRFAAGGENAEKADRNPGSSMAGQSNESHS